jgi:hypothetical protein
MHTVARILSRVLWLVSLGVWSWVMTVLGLLLLVDVPIYAGVAERPFWMLAVGCTLVACGVFCMAATLAPALPKAHPAVTILFELGPWVALAGVLVGAGVLV